MKKVVFVAVVIALIAGIVFGSISIGQEATFGLDSGNAQWSTSPNFCELMRFQNTVGTGTLTRIELLSAQSTPTGSVRLGVYADNSGVPGSLLLDAGNVTVAGSGSWCGISGLSLPVTSGTYYWLCYNLQYLNSLRYQSGRPSNSHATSRSVAYGSLPSTLSGLSYNTNQYVMRAYVTTGGATPTPTPTPTPVPPVAVNDYYSRVVETGFVVAAPGVLGNDTGTSLTASLVTTVSQGSLTLNADGSFNYVPVGRHTGLDSFTYRAYDGVTYSNTATVTVVIVPYAHGDAFSVTAGNTFIWGAPGVLDNDYGTSLTASLVTTVSHGSLTLNSDGSLSYTPTAGYSGTDSFTYRAYDGVSYSNNVTVTATVTIIGTEPTLTAPSANPLQIALLRWYEANQSGITYPVGDEPFGICYDGTNIWVANALSDTVTKLRASDGSLVGTYAVGSYPFGICYDGANIWVTNMESDSVTKLKASDGSLVGTYAVGGDPWYICFDGTNIWVANRSSANVTKLKASDGSLVGNYVVGSDPTGICFDGANIWVISSASSGNYVTKIKASDGSLVGTYDVGYAPWAICFDGTNIWVTNLQGIVTKLRASDSSLVGTYISGGTGICFDGTNIWVANGTVTKLRASDGSLVGNYVAGTGPYGICFDGANIWVTNSGSDTVSKL